MNSPTITLGEPLFINRHPARAFKCARGGARDLAQKRARKRRRGDDRERAARDPPRPRGRGRHARKRRGRSRAYHSRGRRRRHAVTRERPSSETACSRHARWGSLYLPMCGVHAIDAAVKEIGAWLETARPPRESHDRGLRACRPTVAVSPRHRPRVEVRGWPWTV